MSQSRNLSHKTDDQRRKALHHLAGISDNSEPEAETKEAYTPDRWEVGQHPAMSSGWIVRPVLFGSRIQVLPENEGGHVVIKSEKDARLIAAAPDQYTVGKELDRLSLIIESAVRTAYPAYYDEVLALIKANRDAIQRVEV